MKKDNIHTSREAWLQSATHELRPYFEKLGYTIPEKIRFAIAFTSGGKRGKRTGECWHAEASNDQHYEIIIRADMDEPVEILGTLVHELLHTLLPKTAKHGKEFKAIAVRVGLEGPMRHTRPTLILKERLQALAATLGPLPHARLNFTTAADVRKKQPIRYLKAECGQCGYTARITAKWVRIGLPICPADARHGNFVCQTMNNNVDAHGENDGAD